MCVYIYIYICMYVCMCVCSFANRIQYAIINSKFIIYGIDYDHNTEL